jgi:uncharacterized protein with FMN-binding domain
MKRVIVSTVGTVVGLVALLDFKSHGHPMRLSGGLPSAGLPGATAPTSAPSTTTPSSRTPAGARSSAASSATRVVDGDAIQTPYGVVQVELDLHGSKITNIKYLQLTASDFRSQSINSYAAPILLQQALQVQSANISGVAGASFTSSGFAQSVQSALSKAGMK